MALESIITGSYTAGSITPIERITDHNIINIISTLETLNSPEVFNKIQGSGFLDSFIKEVPGLQGHTEGYKEYEVYASDDGLFQDADNYQERYITWSFYRKGYSVKGADFSQALIEDAYESGKDLTVLVNEKIEIIRRMYTQEYLPNVAYETLFTVPVSGGKYSDNFGFLRDVEVADSMLKPFAENNVRNHFMVSAAPGAPTVDDINKVVEYLGEYKDITESEIIALGTRSTLATLKNTLEFEGNRDTFARTMQPTEEIAGVQFIKNDYMPKNVLLFVAGGASHLISKLVSPKPEMRGLALRKEQGTFQKLETVSDITNTIFKIMPEGYHLTGRHYGAFLGLNHADEAALINTLSLHAETLKSKWYRKIK
jgi:hypothetical protein